MTDSNDENKSKLLIKALEFFKPFSDEELNSILDVSRVKKYKIYEYIIKENTKGDFFYIIIRGTVNIVHEGHNNIKRTITTLREGDCFGEMAIILKQPRNATILAASECYVFEIDGKQIDGLSLEIREKLFRQFAVFLSKRLIRTSCR